MKSLAAVLVAGAAWIGGHEAAAAQAWPARTITLVVPFAAGGGTDAMARVVAEKLGARLGQPIVVENRAGAASAIGTAYVAKAAPDGYTLLMTTNSAQVILPLTQPAGSLNYDPAGFQRGRADVDPAEHPDRQPEAAGQHRSPSSSPMPRRVPASFRSRRAATARSRI